ncbi:MAG: O-antigen ligase family protein [Rhizomicrobium sp.]
MSEAVVSTVVLDQPRTGSFARLARSLSLWSLIATIAWAPFPLGSAVSWGASLIEMAVAVSWLFWSVSMIAEPGEIVRNFRLVWFSGLMVLSVLLWCGIQILPIVPADWAHPIWGMAAQALGKPLAGTISIDPWRTKAEILKLASYVAAFWLTLSLARRSEAAKTLLNAIVAITTFYAFYGFVLAILDVAQAELIYAVPFPRPYISGPFMLHNSFATFEGLGTLAALVKAFDAGRESIVMRRGLRQLFLTTFRFAFGRGTPPLLGVILCFTAIIASASRAGFVATSVAILVMAVVATILARHSELRLWTMAAAAAALIAIFLTIALNGQTLGDRFAKLADAGDPDQIRLALWDAAWRMIVDMPWRGLGLGTFQDAYPLYARQALPYVMDRAHCDYLELAAGVGLPAAIAWWVALGGLAMLCLRGTFARRRNRHIPLLGFCAAVLVAIHSSVDFSLQMPAVGTLFAIMLGLGVAQSQRTTEMGSKDAASATVRPDLGHLN